VRREPAAAAAGGPQLRPRRQHAGAVGRQPRRELRVRVRRAPAAAPRAVRARRANAARARPERAAAAAGVCRPRRPLCVPSRSCWARRRAGCAPQLAGGVRLQQLRHGPRGRRAGGGGPARAALAPAGAHPTPLRLLVSSWHPAPSVCGWPCAALLRLETGSGRNRTLVVVPCRPAPRCTLTACAPCGPASHWRAARPARPATRRRPAIATQRRRRRPRMRAPTRAPAHAATAPGRRCRGPRPPCRRASGSAWWTPPRCPATHSPSSGTCCAMRCTRARAALTAAAPLSVNA